MNKIIILALFLSFGVHAVDKVTTVSYEYGVKATIISHDEELNGNNVEIRVAKVVEISDEGEEVWDYRVGREKYHDGYTRIPVVERKDANTVEIFEPGIYEIFYIKSTEYEFKTAYGDTLDVPDIRTHQEVLWRQRIYVPFKKPHNASALANKYAPYIQFNPDEEYFPVSLENLLSFGESNGEEIRISRVSQPSVGENIAMGGELKSFLAHSGHSNSRFDFKKTPTTCSKPCDESLFLREFQKDGLKPTIYWEAAEEEENLFITYFMFYAFDYKSGSYISPATASHALDRESFTIKFHKKDGEYVPDSITYAAHGPDHNMNLLGCNNAFYQCDGPLTGYFFDKKLLSFTGKTTIKWEYASKLNSNPIVYIAKGSHAIYPSYGWYEVYKANEKAGGGLLSPLTSPSDITLEELDYNTHDYMAYSGTWVDGFSLSNDARFPPFINRTPHSLWLSSSDYKFDTCLDETSAKFSSEDCIEVQKLFSIGQFDKYKDSIEDAFNRDTASGEELYENLTKYIVEARLANRIYREGQSTLFNIENGWQLYDYFCDINGFTGGLYKSSSEDKYVISFGGTTSKCNGEDNGTVGSYITEAVTTFGDAVLDIMTDFSLISNFPFKPNQEASAIEFLGRSKVQYAIDNGELISITGHSLGGGLAQYIGLYTNINTVTFNTAPMPFNYDSMYLFLKKYNNGTPALQIPDLNEYGKQENLIFSHTDKIVNLRSIKDPISLIPLKIKKWEQDSQNNPIINKLYLEPIKKAMFIDIELKLDYLINGEIIHLPLSVDSLLASHSMDLFTDYIDSINQPPIANAGNDLFIPVGEPANLDASSSSDDVVIEKFEWHKYGNVISQSSTFVLTDLPVDVHDFTLRVTDNFGEQDTDTVNVVVYDSESDADNDGMPDEWEVANGLDPLTDDSLVDDDGDNRSNYQEYLDGTDPNTYDVYNPTADIDRGLVAYYPFDGGANDYSGNGHDGIENGGVSYVDGVNSLSANFDGINDYIELPTSIISGSEFTVSLWLKSQGVHDGILSGSNENSENEFTLYLDSVANFELHYNTSQSFYRTGLASTQNNWQHVTLVKKGGKTTIYVNGILSWAIDDSIVANISLGSLFLGAEADCVGGCFEDSQYFNGSIDSLRIYNRAITVSEVTELYELDSPVTSGVSLFEGDNYSIRSNQDAYSYRNGTHYIVWSNGLYSTNSLYNQYDAEVKLSKSTDGINWQTSVVANTAYGSFNHKLAVANNGDIHVVYVETVVPGTYSGQSRRLVYASNSSGEFQTTAIENGYSYRYHSPSKLFFTPDGTLNLFYQKSGWWRYNAPLFERTFDGANWSSASLVSNLSFGRGDPDDDENKLLAYEIVEGKKVLYVSSGYWHLTYHGAIEYSGHIFKYTQSGTGYVREQLPYVGTFFDIDSNNIVYASIDRKSIYFNDEKIHEFTNDEEIRSVNYDATSGYIAFNTGDAGYAINIGDSSNHLEQYNDEYLFVKNGMLMRIKWKSNPKRFIVTSIFEPQFN